MKKLLNQFARPKMEDSRPRIVLSLKTGSGATDGVLDKGVLTMLASGGDGAGHSGPV